MVTGTFAIASLPIVARVEYKTAPTGRRLVEHDWISRKDLPELPPGRIDFDETYKRKLPLLQQAAQDFLTRTHPDRSQFEEFKRLNAWWLEDFVLFNVMRQVHAGAAWHTWPRELARRVSLQQTVELVRQTIAVVEEHVPSLAGADEEQAVADYLEAAGESAPPVEPVVDIPSPLRDQDNSKEGEPGVPWGILAIVLLVLALALSVWSYYTRESVKDAKGSPRAAAPEPQAVPAPPQPPVVSSSTPLVLPPQRAAAPGNVSSQIDLAGQRSSAPVAKGIGGLVGSTLSNPTLSPDARNANNAAKQPAAPAVNSFVVLIEAEENSWVSITADGKTILEGTLIAPAIKAVKAQKQIVVKAGNVGGLAFSFNGKKIPTQGGSGEVKALTFDAGGLQVSR